MWFTARARTGPIAIELNGTVDGDTVKGTIGVGGQPAGEWVATRAKDAKRRRSRPKRRAARGDRSGDLRLLP